MIAGRFLRPLLFACALVACDSDNPSSTSDVRPDSTEVEPETTADSTTPDVSPDTAPPDDTVPQESSDTTPPDDTEDIADTTPPDDTEDIADTTPPDDTEDIADTTPPDDTEDIADTAPPDDTEDIADTTPPDDVITIDPDELAFIPGAYNAFSADAPFEIVEVFAVNPTAPAAEDAIGFGAFARTTATTLTVATDAGDRTFTFGDAGVDKDVALSFDPSGQLVAATPSVSNDQRTPGKYGQCWVFSGKLNTLLRTVTPHYKTYDGLRFSYQGNCKMVQDDDTPADIQGTFAVDGRAYAVVVSARPIEVSYANGVAVVMPGTGEPSTYFVALDLPPLGTTAATDVITLVPRVQLVNLLGGDAGRFYFIGDAAATQGSAGGAGTPRTIGVYHIDLTAGARAIATTTWKCGDACLAQVSPSFWCGKTTHFRPVDPTNPGTTTDPEIVLTGLFAGRLELPSGPLVSDGTDPEPFVLVLDGDGNPRIGRKGGGMSVEKVGFTDTGEVILGGTFAGAAALGITATAVGTRDAFIGVFDPATLTPTRSMTHGAPNLDTSLASNWVTPEVRGDCTATGEVGGFALRQGDDIVLAGLGDNGVGCVGEPLPGEGTQIVNGGDGNAFFVLPEGNGIPFSGIGPDGLPQSMVWPPVADWQQTAGSSRARVMNNAR